MPSPETAHYFDHAATAPLAPEVQEAMRPYLGERFGNASTIYPLGVEAAYAVERARLQVLRALHADEAQTRVVFTGSATEAINLAHKGMVWASGRRPAHVISCVTEHSASLQSLRWLETRGEAAVTWLPVGVTGRADPAGVERALRPGTALISLMLANSETGVLHPIAEAARTARAHGVLIHCDAAQAAGKVPVDFAALGVDLLSINAHKFHGPKGVGALLIRGGVEIEPLIHGGGQEGGLRAGTENVAGIVGLGAAIELAVRLREAEATRLLGLRRRVIEGVQSRVRGVHVHGDQTHCLPSTLNLGIEDVEGPRVVALMGERGFSIAAGSACTARGTARSHVLTAMGLPEAQVAGAIRISLGRGNTASSADDLVEALAEVIDSLRRGESA